MAKVDETVGGHEEDAQTEHAARQAELAVPAEIAADSVGDYFRSSIARIKAGESGILPVIAGLLLVSIFFESLDSQFLTAANLVNLLLQAAVFSLLAMGEVFVLLLGEIDLSVGFVAGLGGVIMADLASPAHGWPWWSAIAAALLACAGIGLLQGTIVTRIGLPSFIVTLAGLLFWEGVLLKILGNGGTITIQDDTINNIASANISPLTGWILMLVLVAIFGLTLWRRDSKRRRAGLVAPPPAVTLAQDRRHPPGRRCARPPLQPRSWEGSCRSAACPGSCSSSSACSSSGRCCSAGRGSGATSTRSAATPRLRAAPV